MILTLVVPDPPPTRAHPGRAAERGSPNAGALVRAGEALIRANAGVFPRVFSAIQVVFGKTMPDVDPLGYQPDHPIYEVLQGIGVVVEPGSWSSRNTQDPAADFYVVTFTLEDEQWKPPSWSVREQPYATPTSGNEATEFKLTFTAKVGGGVSGSGVSASFRPGRAPARRTGASTRSLPRQ